MRHLLILSAVVAAIAAMSGTAQAQSELNYPWCAYYGNGFGGENCGFSTYAQCMETISGMGGFCMVNTQYVPPAAPHRPRRRHRRASQG